MKKLLLFIAAVAFLLQSGAAFSQSVYSYRFFNNLTGTNGAPVLSPTCVGSYQVVHLSHYGNMPYTVYRFTSGCGFSYIDSTNFLQAGSYTIEMYAELDNVSGYRKLVDYKNRTTDDGLYDNDGACNFRGPGNVSGSYFTNGVYSLITITRNATSGVVKMFVDGSYVDQFNDPTGVYAFYDAAKRLAFFLDDTYSSDTEVSAGSIALLNIYNYELDSTTAIAHYGSLGTQLGLKKLEGHSSTIQITPNPATSQLYINNTGMASCNYYIYDMAGRALTKGTAATGTNTVNISYLPTGLYVMKTYDETGPAAVFKFQKI